MPSLHPRCCCSKSVFCLYPLAVATFCEKKKVYCLLIYLKKPLLRTKLSKKCPHGVSELAQGLGFEEDQVFNSAEVVQHLAPYSISWSGTGGCRSYWSRMVQNHSTSAAFSGAEVLEGCSTGCAGGEGKQHGQLQQRVSFTWCRTGQAGLGWGRLVWAVPA